MNKLLVKRILASVIDYGIITAYAIILFLIVTLAFSQLNIKLSGNPIVGQAIGFITLTLPIIVYSYLIEKSYWKGTVGKKLLKIAVLTDHSRTAKNILVRNILKYLPWEIAHTGVHWIVYYSNMNMEIPIWVWTVLILPQLISFSYFVSIVASKGQSSVYDIFSKTRIVSEDHAQI